MQLDTSNVCHLQQTVPVAATPSGQTASGTQAEPMTTTTITPFPPVSAESSLLKADKMSTTSDIDMPVREDLPQNTPAASAAPVMSETELSNLYDSLESLKKELAQVRQSERRNAAAVGKLVSMERERDRYRSTVLSLAYQNKVLNDELTRSRRGLSGREEKYVDARLQIQDLREALALKEKEVEELKEARNFMPTSDTGLLESYHRMRDVFESLRSTLSCSLCFELFRPNEATTLECGHTMCSNCLKQWNESHIRLYNLATTPDCPECRQPGKHYVKVFMLEEVVRTVDRLERLEAEAEAMKQAERKGVLEAEKANAEEAQQQVMDQQSNMEEEAAEISATLPGST